MSAEDKVGFVIIGRNEGERLVNCLQSVGKAQIVYVDSGSTDNSVVSASSLGANVLELDMNRPFTAARARNEGFARLIQLYPSIEYVQFVDGDCEVDAQWVTKAVKLLERRDDVAVVCGLRIEKYRHASLYNELCAIEWDTPIGEARACGGDAMFRKDVLSLVSGYDESFVAGEEPELCYRIRAEGYKILRIDEDMTYHDANMMHLSQWWKRYKRSGVAYALSYKKYGRQQPEYFRKKECRSILFWGGVYPLLTLGVSLFSAYLGLVLLCLYAANLWRLYRRELRVRSLPDRSVALYVISNMLGKVPQLFGLLEVYKKHLQKDQMKIIEYK